RGERLEHAVRLRHRLLREPALRRRTGGDGGGGGLPRTNPTNTRLRLAARAQRQPGKVRRGFWKAQTTGRRGGGQPMSAHTTGVVSVAPSDRTVEGRPEESAGHYPATGAAAPAGW